MLFLKKNLLIRNGRNRLITDAFRDRGLSFVSGLFLQLQQVVPTRLRVLGGHYAACHTARFLAAAPFARTTEAPTTARGRRRRGAADRRVVARAFTRGNRVDGGLQQRLLLGRPSG